MTEEKQDSKDQPKATKEKDAPTKLIEPSDGKRTPDEWMARLQNYTLGRKLGKLSRAKMPTWQHSCADAMSGWTQHKHDANEPYRLTQKDYEGALKAAEAPPYKPPKGAISPHCKIKHDA